MPQNAARIQEISTDTPRVRHVTEELWPAAALPELQSQLKREGRSGKLILNYVNGAPRGYIEWTERKEVKP